METEQSLGLNRQQHLQIAATIWIVVGTGLLTMGSIFWFHFPYLGFIVGGASPVANREHVGSIMELSAISRCSEGVGFRFWKALLTHPHIHTSTPLPSQ